MLVNAPAPQLPYFTPAQVPPAGTAFDPQPDGKPIPKLFKPIKIRGLEFHNRIFLSPLCQYSANNGALTPWHMSHRSFSLLRTSVRNFSLREYFIVGGIFTRGPGLTVIEATGVVPQGRITPEDSGLWCDEQIEPMRQIVEFAHSQGQKVGIQLAHAGRKASTIAPWLSFAETATEVHGGWPDDVWAPSAIQFGDGFPYPKELSKEGIQELVKAWADSARRALKAGIDVIEIHNAHGYLLHEFLSPVSNKRTDEYGGSFENRIRFSLEVIAAIRAVIPESMPLFLRISATDWLEESLANEPSWRIEDTVKFAGIIAEHGVDLIDVSSGGNHPKQSIKFGAMWHAPTAYQSPFAEAVRKVHGVDVGSETAKGKKGIYVGSVGGIKTGEIANEVLEKEMADLVFVGRQFQKDPASVWTFAEDLGVSVKVAHQIEWGFRGRGSSRGETKVKAKA